MTLQENLALLRLGRAPLPMFGMQEVSQALRLRRAGLTYASIATTMSVYHGSTRSEGSWRYVLRSQGAAPKHHPRSPRLAPQQRDAS